MQSEPESKTEPKEQENADRQGTETTPLLVGAALNLGRAARVVTSCFQILGANVKRLGGGITVKEPNAEPNAVSETAVMQEAAEPEQKKSSVDGGKKGGEPEKEKKRKS